MTFHIEYSPELVPRKVHDLFPEEQWPEVFKILNFDPVNPDSPGTVRIQLAMLKVSEGNLIKLDEAARMAKRDDRDVLTRAEYPSILRDGKVDFSGQNKEADRQQYIDWINSTNQPKDRG
jgi:hypothetical protein